jgi:hypothetical protein
MATNTVYVCVGYAAQICTDLPLCARSRRGTPGGIRITVRALSSPGYLPCREMSAYAAGAQSQLTRRDDL